jgi:hypothetical protein
MKSDRRMFIECSVMLAICITFIGVWGFCIMRQVSQSKPMTQEEIQEDAAASYQLDREDYSP